MTSLVSGTKFRTQGSRLETDALMSPHRRIKYDETQDLAELVHRITSLVKESFGRKEFHRKSTEISVRYIKLSLAICF